MDWETLAEKLKAMGMQLGGEQLPKTPQRKPVPIDQVVNGTYQETIFGPVFCLQETFPLDHVHGNIKLNAYNSIRVLSEWARCPEIDDSQLRNLVFLDTETTGLSGGTGTMAFMVGVGRYTDEGFVLAQYFLKNPSEEPALLAGLSQFVDSLSAVVTYNGKSFDMPLLQTRYIMHRLSTPFVNIAHFDLLTLARRIWRERLESCTLGNIEHQVLGVTRSNEEVPGYLVPEIYATYLRTGDARPIQGIFYHNAIDILSLAALFVHATQILELPTSTKTQNGIDIASIARLFQAMGKTDIASALYAESTQHDLPASLLARTLMDQAGIHKKQGNFDEAIVLWQKAVAFDRLDACEELAKYEEHQQRDFLKAMNWVLKAFSLSEKLNETERYSWHQRLVYRQERLTRKINHC